MKRIIFVTGNKYKFEIAQKALKGTGVELIQQKIETPEIQSTDVREIASFSARYAARSLGKPVALTDAGWYITALNGFPGPFIKFINQWLTSEEILKLMEGKKDRRVTIKGCLAYCEPNGELITFSSQAIGSLSEKAVKTNKEENTPINELFIPEGYNGRVESEIPREEMIKYWARVESYWEKLAGYLK